MHGGEIAVGVRRDGGIVPVGYSELVDLMLDGEHGIERAREAAERGEPFEPERVLAPIPRPGKILCSGINYASNKQENPDAVFPDEPFFFSKLPSAVTSRNVRRGTTDSAMRLPPESSLNARMRRSGRGVTSAGYLIVRRR